MWAVRRSPPFPISSRDLERMLADRGVPVDHVTLDRWVQRFAPELERPPGGGSAGDHAPAGPPPRGPQAGCVSPATPGAEGPAPRPRPRAYRR